MRNYESIAGITVGAAGTDSTIPVPVNRRAHIIRLYASATNSVPATVYGADVLDDIQFYVGTNLVRNIKASQLLDIAKGNGHTVTPSATVGLPIYFTEPWRQTPDDEQMSAWDLWGAPAFTIKARTKAGLTSPSVTAILDYDGGYALDRAGKRVLNIIKQEPVALGVLGTTADILSPVIPVDLPIQRIWVYPDSGVTMNRVKLTVNDSQVVFDMSQAENANFLADYDMVGELGNGKVFPVILDMDQMTLDGLPPVRSLKLTLNQSGSGAVNLLLERRAPAYI
ncbi:MAG: hypothetical protein H3C27_08580 [Opitutaceae bacterium]|nr:hypothetical protein [Opitutaceae bacterium]